MLFFLSLLQHWFLSPCYAQQQPQAQLSHLQDFAVDEAAQLKYFRRVAQGTLAGWEGCTGAESIFYMLKASFERGGRRGAIVDVGANIGDTIVAAITVFASEMMMAPIYPFQCNDLNGGVTVYAFEPNPETFAALKERLESSPGLQKMRLFAVKAALSDTPGNMTLYHRGAGDTLASLSESAANSHNESWAGEPNHRTEVQILTLETAIRDRQAIHLLKVDAEGYDPLVLRGAQSFLKRRRIKFLVFEFSEVPWREAGHGISLHIAVSELHHHGYACFLMTRAALVPVYGRWWQDLYGGIKWANFFCGQLGDHDLFDAYVAYGTNNYTLAHALTHLRAVSGSPWWGWPIPEGYGTQG